MMGCHYSISTTSRVGPSRAHLIRILSSSFSVQGMDEYSNILYVKESPAAMSHLAHRVALDDKYRPESCCIIGNYYSLSAMHEKVACFLSTKL
jgi:hypothetical protein